MDASSPAATARNWSVGARELATLGLVFVTLDLLFLPMFHLGGIPWKPSFLLVLLYLPQVAKTRDHRRLLAIAAAMIVLFLLGTLTFWLYQGFQLERETTLTYLAIWVLVPCGFAFGFGRFRAGSTFLIPLIVVYMAINVYLWLFFDSATWLTRFYGLGTRVEEGLFAYRNMGIMFNPNVSAMGIILLTVFLLIGYERGVLGLQSKRGMVIALIAACITLLTFASRGSLVLFALMTAFFLRRRIFSPNLVRIGVPVFIALVVIANLSTQIPVVAERANQVLSLPNDFRHTFDLSEEANQANNLMRPFFKAQIAIERFMYSPVWGTGMEVVRQHEPFHDVNFHDDALVILVAQGLLGFIAYAALLRRSYLISIYALVPFFNGWVNSFVTLPSHLLFFSIMLGYHYGVRYHASAYLRKKGAMMYELGIDPKASVETSS